MTYKTNLKTLKQVYEIAERVGLEFILTGGEGKLDLQKICSEVFKDDIVNDFCQLVTGETDIDFEEKELDELESVILGFFDFIKAKFGDLNIFKRFSKRQ